MKLSSHLVYNPSCWQRNIDPEDYRTITDLMQPLDVYSVILVEFAPEGVRYLWAVLYASTAIISIICLRCTPMTLSCRITSLSTNVA
jgi:hypothetical protein